jgi:hypothetical protein
VVGDPFVPYWYHPRYVVPVASVEAAVRQFCRTGGARPTGITWTGDGGRPERLYLRTDQYREFSSAG